ncbi:thioredoxin family protein [Myroides ceti]|uniref:Thioredoxin family protein n=1 Tax=Paenimyroides ceti TaxID=395087 RepID=A0ABT8D0F7_9FLAO|nr:thioredoxin family protein [Paenimyroides ceti]MDN3707576.1 thioredoxin family protein [Paenimyroides ceti]MDN3709841.1 thioredoxin family protein [Paenimyroides ceti]
MKKAAQLILVFCLVFCTNSIVAQTVRKSDKEILEKPYKPEEDAQAKIDALFVQAKKQHKNIIIQAGGNWCVWCLRFNDYIKKTPEIKKVVDNNFLYYHLNFSSENKNEKVFKKYAPDGAQLGYPFFIVLDASGKVLKLQESGSMESGKGYDKEKVLAFFKQWKAK